MNAPLGKRLVEERVSSESGDKYTLWSDREHLRQRFPEMEAIDHAPSLRTINLCGTMLYGVRDYDLETQTYVATVVIVFFLVPVCFLGAYRVRSASGGGWYFLGKVPLSGKARTVNRVTIPIMISAAVTWYLTGLVIPTIESPDPIALTLVGTFTTIFLILGVCGVILWRRQKAATRIQR